MSCMKKEVIAMAEDKIVFCLACGARNRVAAQQAHRIPKCGKCGTSLVHAPVSGKVNELADGEFSHYVDEFHLPVLVDFYSPTCGPCRMLAPVLENLAGRYASKLVFYKVDTSRQQIQASRFRIQGVPSLLFIKYGKEVDRVVGAVPEGDLARKIEAFLR